MLKKDSEEIKKLKAIKKQIKQMKTMEDLDALEEELIAIGLIDKAELERLKKKKSKKKRKSEKERFEERVRCNLAIINQTILVGKQFKEQARHKKDEELKRDRDERTIGGNRRKDKNEVR